MKKWHIVMFSSGAGSWAAARRVADEHGTERLGLLFSDVSGEDWDNYRFLIESAADIFGIDLPTDWQASMPDPEDDDQKYASALLEFAERYIPRLVWLSDGRTIWDVFRENRFLGNSRLANCSKFLKQEPARQWLDRRCKPEKTVVYVGIDWTETHRMAAIEANYRPYAAKAPLCDAPYVSKDEILADLRSRGIEPPRLYEMGFAHANCGGGCVRAGQGSFATLLEVMPSRFAEWEREEQSVREYLGKDVAILRDRRDGQSRPLTLKQFRERHEAKPTATDRLDIGGCGCFVDEGDPNLAAPADPLEA